MTDHSVREQNRFDLQIELVGHDPEQGQPVYKVRPDPGRYVWRGRELNTSTETAYILNVWGVGYRLVASG